jgi:dTDP-4-amino-4,6-dideoxygalactose transaminase
LAVDWRVRFVDYPEQWRRQRAELLPIIEDTIARGDLMLRQQLHDFEDHLAAFNHSARAVGVSNCTDGLRLLAHALDVGPGDEVVSVAHTFIATVSPFVLRGAKPVFVDIGPDHLMDTGLLAEAVTERTKVIIPVHLNGRTVDMHAVGKAAASVGAVVLEDAAQALGATFDGRTAGTFGRASTYSFYPAKMLGALGDAGAVLTDDQELADRLLRLRDHGRVQKAEIDGWGYNCRLDNLQAAVLDYRLTKLAGWIERRREIARRYHERLSDLDDLSIPVGPDADPLRRDVYQNYPVTTAGRDRLFQHLRDDGIETLISWPIPLHQQRGLDLSHWRLPRTEQLCREVLSLPMQVELDDWQVDHVADSVRRFFGR